jgi:hypothetical protein
MDAIEHFTQIIGEKTLECPTIRFLFEFNDGSKNTTDDIIEIYVFIVRKFIVKNNVV